MEEEAPIHGDITQDNEPKQAEVIQLAPEEIVSDVSMPTDEEVKPDTPGITLEDVPAIHQADEQLEVIELETEYSREVIETFHELLAQLEVKEAAVYEDKPIYPGEAIEIESPAEELSFAEVLAERPKPELIPAITEVIAEANEQGLEETLAILSFSLAEAPDEPKAVEINDAIQKVIEAMIYTVPTKPDEAPRVVITPELTSKLLDLLSVIGFEDPKATLLEFTREHSLAYLLQSIKYLHQLQDDENRQEFANKYLSVQTDSEDENTFSARAGRVLVHYFFTFA